MSKTLYLFPVLERKFGQFSFRILTIIYMTALLQGVHLLITSALDIGFLVSENVSLKLINSCASPLYECGLDSESVKHFFLYLKKILAQGMPLNATSSFSLLVIF